MAGNGILRLLAANGRLGLEPFLRGGWQAFGWVAGETLINVSAILGTLMLAGRFDFIGSWSSQSLHFLLGYVLLARGIANVFAGRNVLMISRRIGRGQLDHSLLQPIPLWKALAAEGFSPFDLVVTVALGAGVVAWSAARLPATHNALWIGEFVLNLVGSVGVIIAYQYLWGALAFWAPFGAEEVNSASAEVVGQLSAYPLDQAPRALTGLLITAVPVGVIGWLPARNLLDMSSGPLSSPLTVPLLSAVFIALAWFIFRLGMKRYERYGSGRYSDFGHRR